MMSAKWRVMTARRLRWADGRDGRDTAGGGGCEWGRIDGGQVRRRSHGEG